ncbi:DUF2285 domain-containing protein [Sinorhizobium meliloti]|nr:DUF2285 domain-containing protein [Sinorhizobium meliloti]
MLWSPLINPGIPILGPLHPDIGIVRDSPDGRHVIGDSNVVLDGVEPNQAVSHIIFDRNTPDRLDATDRIWRASNGLPVPPDRRITPDRRRRLRHKIQAADGRSNGATFREIAIVIFGEARIAEEPWKTSSQRDRVIGLVKGSSELIAGDYVLLLRKRRRS